MRRRQALLGAVGLLAAGLVGGCAPSTATATIRGTVTVDGQPVEKGVISFSPKDGQGEPVTGEIVAGKYEVRTTPGAKRVAISVPRVTGKRKAYQGPDAPMIDITEESVPEKYNTATELTLDVPPAGTSKDWAVESKKKK